MTNVIKNWHYDCGLPYYMPAIDKWSKSRTPSYRCSIDAAHPEIKLIEKWLNDNCPSADFCIRFNSGWPHMFIEITNDQEAMQFFLRWS